MVGFVAFKLIIHVAICICLENLVETSLAYVAFAGDTDFSRRDWGSSGQGPSMVVTALTAPCAPSTTTCTEGFGWYAAALVEGKKATEMRRRDDMHDDYKLPACHFLRAGVG